MRGEILGFERRRRWSDEEKLGIVMAVGVDDATVTQVAQRHEITRQQIYAWRHEMKKKGLWSPDGWCSLPPFRYSCIWRSHHRGHAHHSGRDGGRTAPVQRPQPALRQQHGCGGADAADPCGGSGMIGPGTGVRVYVACGVTDMRKGIAGLAALTQDVLRQKPTGGAVFAFRGRRGDRLKLLYWDGQGFCLYYKVLERGRFPWPAMTEGAARLTSAQLAMLWEGIDWRRPDWGAPPARVG